ncbi:peptidylprolyl isomerase [Bacteroidota bacterium]
MIVSKDKVISVTYELRVNGTDEVVEIVNEEKPLEFIHGSGTLLSSFETNLNGLSAGNPFDFVLNHVDAYGELNEEAIMDLPINVFMVDGKLDEQVISIGNMVPMRDNQGRQFNGKVIGVTAETVKMDFNHPMAGKDLNFKGQIVDIREATADELANGLYGSSCGCGGSCGSGDDGCEPADCEKDDCAGGNGACGC